jgi:repressor LexA
MLNDRALKILAFIKRVIREEGRPPTIREIGEEFEIASTNGVRYYLSLLVKAHKIILRDKISRGIEVVQDPLSISSMGIPIVGSIAAGLPILAVDIVVSDIATTEMFGSPDGLFALKVRGDSMIDAGIMDGDFVVVRAQERANPGEIVVARTEDEATVVLPPQGGATSNSWRPIRSSNRCGFAENPLVIDGVVRGVLRIVR